MQKKKRMALNWVRNQNYLNHHHLQYYKNKLNLQIKSQRFEKKKKEYHLLLKYFLYDYRTKFFHLDQIKLHMLQEFL